MNYRYEVQYQMNVLEIAPSKQVKFSLPGDMQRVLTLTNLTLHSVFVLILNSHPFELSLSHSCFLLQAFEEKKVHLNLNWLQEATNLSAAKIRVYYLEVEEESPLSQLQSIVLSQQSSCSFAELEVGLSLDGKELQYLSYCSQEEEERRTEREKKVYQLRRISHLDRSQQEQARIDSSQSLKDRILSYLQHLPEVLSIEPCDQDGSYLAQFAPSKQQACSIIHFPSEQESYVYAFKRIVAYGQPATMTPLLSMQSSSPTPKASEVQNPHLKPLSPQRQHKSPVRVSRIQEDLSKEAEQHPVEKKPMTSDFRREERNSKRDALKQSFVARRHDVVDRVKRRNRSEQKIVEASSEEEENSIREELRELRRLQLEKGKEKREKGPSFKETTVELTEKVLGVWVEEKEGATEVYVVLRDCVRCFILEEPLARKSIKFDPIYEENVGLPCPIERYQDELIFGNESTLYWVNTVSGEAEWKYVQRKDIYCLSVIEELSLVGVGGRSFSKLSYFGKSTARSNIKLYSCSSADKHDHLFTYDLPGDNVGNVLSMAYVSVPPHGIRLLLVHTLSHSSSSSLYFLRVKAFNKIEVYGQIDLDELGIINLLKLKHNRATSRVVCLETLGEAPQVDCFKRLKIRCQYEKVEVATEGIKVPLKQYIFFHLGGNQNPHQEWMTLVDRNGALCHVYNFETGDVQTLELGKGELRQIFWLKGGKYLLVASDFSLLFRERLQSVEP